MKSRLTQVRAELAARAASEWRDLMNLEYELAKNNVSATESLVDAQRARWAAWDAAAEIAKGEAVTSHKTAQRSH